MFLLYRNVSTTVFLLYRNVAGDDELLRYLHISIQIEVVISFVNLIAYKLQILFVGTDF